MSARGPSRFAPLLAGAMLLALLGWSYAERGTTGSVDAYMEEAAARIDAVPSVINGFYSAEQSIEQLPGVIRLLDPNRILQRRYVHPDTGEWFSLLIVHCQRADDMYGHYPPNCYPNAGWKSDGAPGEVVVRATDLEIPARRYRFRHEGGIVARRTDILGFFVVPAGTARFGGDMTIVDRLSRSPATDKLGAAQVQILTPAEMPEERRREVWSKTLEAIAPALQTIAEGS